MMYLGNQAVGMATSLPIFNDKVEIEYGEYVPENDIDINNNPVSISHNLGAVPDFIYFFTPNIEIKDTYSKIYLICYMAIFIKKDDVMHVYVRGIKPNSTSMINIGSNVTRESWINSNWSSTSNFLIICNHATNICNLKANVKYHYIIGKFKEVTSNAN